MGVVERYYCVGTAGELFSSHGWRCIASPSDRRQAALASTETSTASTATKSALRATKLDKLSNPPSLSPSQLTGIRPLEPTARVIERFHYFLESHHPSPCRPLPQAPGLEEDAIRPGCGPVSRFAQPSPDEVHAQLDRVTDQLQNRFPQVASLLDEAGPDVLAFSNFPLAHWKKIWSNNPQERLNKEIRRRTDVVGIFPNRPAVRRLVGAVLAEQNDEWAVARRYITPVVLTFNKALPEADLAEATAA